MKNIFLLLTIAAFVFAFTEINTVGDPWDIPSKYDNMENPTSADDADCLDVGKSLYVKHCRSCHGSEGFGDGKKAGEIDTEMPDISTDEYKNQPAGHIYFKSFIGREDMPNFEKKIPSEEDRWCIINYMDTF
ncbi:MAG: cytochrome c [Saprospiraceae bacterium]|nr:cytochrome c [Saprospiraceae bacterium]